MKMVDACPIGQIFVTATGSTGLIRGEHMMKMRHMAILCNIGSGQTEIDVLWLKSNAIRIENLKPQVKSFSEQFFHFQFNHRSIFII